MVYHESCVIKDILKRCTFLMTQAIPFRKKKSKERDLHFNYGQYYTSGGSHIPEDVRCLVTHQRVLHAKECTLHPVVNDCTLWRRVCA